MPYTLNPFTGNFDYYAPPSGTGDTYNTNNYSSLLAPQLFNPDASAVTANTDDYTLSTANTVAIVTLNGQVLDDSEYSLAGTTLTVTPDAGFAGTDDEVLVYQHSFSVTGTGGQTLSYVTKATNYTATLSDYYIDCTATLTITLPTAVDIGGQSFVIKNSGTGTVTVDGDGTETIDGGLTAEISTQYESITVVSNGSDWIII